MKAAIDCCVLLNQWDQAVTLAESHEFPQVRRAPSCARQPPFPPVLCAQAEGQGQAPGVEPLLPSAASSVSRVPPCAAFEHRVSSLMCAWCVCLLFSSLLSTFCLTAFL